MLLRRKFAVENLRNDIVAQIESGELSPGASVMSGPELSRLYGISYPTVNKILNHLVDEGYMYRVRGKGTFVSPRSSVENGEDSRMIGVLMRYEGDVYENLFKKLNNHLQSLGCLSLATDITTESFRDAPERRIREMMNVNPSALILEGVFEFPFHILKRFENQIKRLVVVMRLDTDEALEADIILPDHMKGGYLATRHLLELGHRRIACETYQGVDAADLPHRIHWLKLQGYLQALKEFGIPEKEAMIMGINEHGDKEKQFHSVFSRPNRPTAVIAMSDNRVDYMMRTLKKLELRVPDDVSVVGYNNTPWCGVFDVPLTSVAIREDEIARLAFERLQAAFNNPEEKYLKILVEPKLVIRSSTSISGDLQKTRRGKCV